METQGHHLGHLPARRFAAPTDARRVALGVAAFFVVVAAAYWFLTYDPGGSFLIGMVGATIGLGAYALVRGSANIY